MSVELRPLGVVCNIACQYCYQNPQRDAGNVSNRYDMETMKAAILKEGGPFTLFGGEALLVPADDLEDLWAWGLEQFGRNYLQTNGTLISERHISLFRRYKVSVGVSLDGPAEFNDARWNGTLARTRDATAKAERAIEWLCAEGMAPSLIVTLHRNNATDDKLPRMSQWFRDLHRTGVRSVRLHTLEVEHEAIRKKYALSIEENLRALLHFAPLERELNGFCIDVFSDMARMLEARDDGASCVWKACDPWTTDAVRGVEGQGQRSNCGRTNKDGVDFVKAGTRGFERSLALYHAPQASGGCAGCRFFLACKGQCPGTAIDGDWRNRSEHCRLWMALFEQMESRLLAEGRSPLSLMRERASLETAMLRSWARGQNPSLSHLLHRIRTATNDHVQTA